APPVLYTLSLHDALPIWPSQRIVNWLRSLPQLPRSDGQNCPRQPAGREESIGAVACRLLAASGAKVVVQGRDGTAINEVVDTIRSEEHTSELQSLAYLVC